MSAATVGQPRTVHVEHCMGTVFSIDLRDAGDWTVAIARVVGWLHRVDGIFSTYRPDSDISRIRRGDLALADADPLVAEVVGRCEQLAAETGGYFSAFWDGRLDPTGLVKGWAIEHASDLLRAQGCRNHAVNGGGDIQLSGESAPGRPWRVGISDPFDATRVRTVAIGRDFAVATSGIAERGQHVLDPHTGRPTDQLASVTITGRRLTTTDAYATAALAMGESALGWLQSLPEYEGFLVTATGAVQCTAGFDRIVGA